MNYTRAGRGLERAFVEVFYPEEQMKEGKKTSLVEPFFPHRVIKPSCLNLVCGFSVLYSSPHDRFERKYLAREREMKREARRGTNSPRAGADRVSESSWLAPQTSRVLNGSLAFPGTRAAPSGRQR